MITEEMNNLIDSMKRTHSEIESAQQNLGSIHALIRNKAEESIKKIILENMPNVKISWLVIIEDQHVSIIMDSFDDFLMKNGKWGKSDNGKIKECIPPVFESQIADLQLKIYQLTGLSVHIPDTKLPW